MSAMNVIVTDNAVHFLTDGAACFRGKFKRTAQKIFPIAHMNCAIAGRGSVVALRSLANWAQGNFSTFDQLCEGIEKGLLKKRYGLLTRVLPLFHFQAIFGGFSESTGEAKAIVLTTGKGGGDFTPWHPEVVPFYLCAPSDDNLQQKVASIAGRRISSPGLIEWLSRQRQMSSGDFMVGGFAQWTVIERYQLSPGNYCAEIRTSVIQRWNEKANQPIDGDIPPIGWTIGPNSPFSKPVVTGR